MPIKPENLAKYPPAATWAKIRAEVLARDGNRCKTCRVPNHAWGIRWPAGTFSHAKGHDSFAGARSWVKQHFPHCRLDRSGRLWMPERGNHCRRDGNVIMIVLTIAHLDHDPGNNGRPDDRPNLAALCQKCHNAHDREHRQKNAAATREKTQKNSRTEPITS